MARSRKLEDTLAALKQLRNDPTADRAIATLREVLGSKASHAVAAAARIAGEFEIAQLTPDLVAAFDRFMADPAKTDPGCRAKAEIAEALYRIGDGSETIFLRGIRHVQMEPVYGGRVDTAAHLRGCCAMGLVRMNYPDMLIELADLLADNEAPARVAATQAIAYSENAHGVPLLRLKVLVGDDEPQVIGECLAALLKLAPVPSLPFVARLLDARDAHISEAAALALGGSRLHEAFDILRQWWERTADSDRRRIGLLAIAMLRHDQPIQFLLSVVSETPGPSARAAIAALGMYQHDEVLRERVRGAVAGRNDLDLRDAFAAAFPEGADQ